jgi:hypothetical protein
MFKTLLSVLVTLIRLGVTLSLVLLIGVLSMFFKWYANHGETMTAISCLVALVSCIGCIYLIWRNNK